VRCYSFDRVAGANPLTGLPSATHGEVPGRRQPMGQEREGLMARPTNPTPHPDAFAQFVVSLAES